MVRTLGDLDNNNNNNNQGGARGGGGMGRFFGQGFGGGGGGGFDYKKVPMFFYLYLIVVGGLMVIGMITGISQYLMNVPYYTVFNFRIWTMLTSVLVSMGLINFIINCLMVFFMSMGEEKQLGTARLILEFIYKNFAIQVIFTTFGLFAGLTIGLWKMYSAGIWPAYFTFLTIRCLKNPEGTSQFCFFPCPIKNKYYPLVLLAIFMMMGGVTTQLACVFGWALGVLINRNVLIRTFLTPSLEKIQKVENFLKRFDGKIGCLIPSSGDISGGNQGGNQNTPAPQQPAPPSNGGVFSAFGGRGTTLGGSSNDQVFSNYDHLDNPTQPATQPQVTIADEEQANQNSSGETMTPFAQSQFYPKDEEIIPDLHP